MKLLIASMLLLISYFIRVYVGLSIKTYPFNRPEIFRSDTALFLGMIIWVGLLIYAGHIFYTINPIVFGVALVFYFFILNFLFLKHLIKSFGGDVAFPECIKYCEGIIKAMVDSYVCRKKVYNNKSEKEILLITLKSRYPFMNKKRRKEIVDKCNNIRELVYKALEIDLIDFSIKKASVIKDKIDEMIEGRLKH